LSVGERIALVAPSALAAAMPRTVLGDLGRGLPGHAPTMDAPRAARPPPGPRLINPCHGVSFVLPWAR
ncbi:hypothetical protein ACFVZ3_34290, partial [Kitasatospora purpeofusca]|uniref:hypothetical protein n=1 Tax=Kitasatospora purpeofusca TaxID=67352 RepID=UPI0036C332A4